MEQELLTLPENLSSAPVFSGLRVTRSLVLWVCYIYRCLSFIFLAIVLSVILRFNDRKYPFIGFANASPVTQFATIKSLIDAVKFSNTIQLSPNYTLSSKKIPNFSTFQKYAFFFIQYNKHVFLTYLMICKIFSNCLIITDHSLFVSKAWRYYRGNQNPYIEEELTTPWPK